MQLELATIFGKHAVGEALRARPDVVKEVYLGEDVVYPELTELLKKHNLRPQPLSPKRIKELGADAVHQGVVAVIDPSLLVHEYDAFIPNVEITPDTAFVVLGEVQDPQNVGSIIRSASAFGVKAILIPQHRQAPINATVIKVSAGMAFRIPLVMIGNVNATILDLKERGCWIYGLEGNATQSVYREGFEKASVFIVGNEALGIREKTLEHCDIPLMIPMHPQAESLNAAVATAVVLSEWSSKHPGALK
jgi:23S rRNA (guanosine2251-2'-O)-methyltransferase